MDSYKHLLARISRNIKYLNKTLSDFYEFEDKCKNIGASINSEDLKTFKQLEQDVAMFSGLCDFYHIEFEEEVEPCSAILKVD